jgi:hypothetical protein
MCLNDDNNIMLNSDEMSFSSDDTGGKEDYNSSSSTATTTTMTEQQRLESGHGDILKRCNHIYGQTSFNEQVLDFVLALLKSKRAAQAIGFSDEISFSSDDTGGKEDCDSSSLTATTTTMTEQQRLESGHGDILKRCNHIYGRTLFNEQALDFILALLKSKRVAQAIGLKPRRINKFGVTIYYK